MFVVSSLMAIISTRPPSPSRYHRHRVHPPEPITTPRLLPGDRPPGPSPLSPSALSHPPAAVGAMDVTQVTNRPPSLSFASVLGDVVIRPAAVPFARPSWW